MIQNIHVRMGLKDEAPPTSSDLRLNMIDAFGNLDFGQGQLLEGLRALDVSPSELAIDLLVIATSVYAADTGISRYAHADDRWTRMIHLEIPVSDPARWNAVGAELASTLRFLSGDHWSFQFRPRPSEHVTIAKAPEKLPLQMFDRVRLFSGGLDSLIGAIDALQDGGKPLLVSHYWDGDASSAQGKLLPHLEKAFPDAFKSLRVRIGFPKSEIPSAGNETTQRARSFLFYCLAAVAADALPSTDRIVIPENGLIALNVPMDHLRLGSASTRTAHPHFISSMQTLLCRIGIDVVMDNPFAFKTKGEMVRECANLALLKKLIPLSMSCAHPAEQRFKGLPPGHCGTCFPCLIRRAAIAEGMTDEDNTTYGISDLKARNWDSRLAEGKTLRSFLYAAEVLKSKPERARYLVRKPGPLPAARIDDYADLYERGMSELSSFLDGVKARREP